MSSILSIAISGMTAATRRLEVSARNVANVRSDGPLPSASAAAQATYPPAYRPQRVDQVETAGGGTVANVSHEQPSTIATYDPGAPYADDQGMVASPNVDLADEAVQQLIASATYAANARLVRTYQQMTSSLLDIKS